MSTDCSALWCFSSNGRQDGESRAKAVSTENTAENPCNRSNFLQCGACFGTLRSSSQSTGPPRESDTRVASCLARLAGSDSFLARDLALCSNFCRSGSKSLLI